MDLLPAKLTVSPSLPINIFLPRNNAYPLLVDELKVRIVDEGMFRLKLCLSELSLEEVNHRINDHTLSVAQSIVHLNGNVRQWLFEHVLNQENQRYRDKEFVHTAKSKIELFEILAILESDILAFLPLLKKADPDKILCIQGIENTTVSALVHIIEHFSYHTGQVALLTKIRHNRDLGFYANHTDLG